ncbi:MAG: VaFE repeat-containing surface-anchored protein [Candidatus Microbacterium colombiense]|nr:MAG: VaFE repeat-containing surface-anchored protein [Microbacterium sp.]
MNQQKNYRSRVGRWVGASVLALGMLIAPTAASAAVDAGDPVYVGSKQGYGGTGVFPIWSETPAVGDPDFWAYCIEHDVSARTQLEGYVGNLDDYLGDNYVTDPAVQGKVLWVLAHSYPALTLEEFGAAAGVPDISRNDAIEATQYAIWRYTDLTFDAAWNWETPDSEAAYWHLVNGANANAGMTPADFEVTATIDAPAAAQTADSLVGPFVVHTSQPTVSVTVDPTVSLVDANGDAIASNAVVDGQELYLDLRGSTAAGSATVSVTATGSSATGKIISVPSSAAPTPTAENHAQTIILVAPSTATTADAATVEWTTTAVAAPSIGTSLVDSADGDRILPWNGGTVIDTVAYQNLTPGTEYTLTGELQNKADGTATGITGSTTFTPETANGTIDVTFTIPTGYAGTTLVAFERLHEGTDTTGESVAVHEDIDDAAQTVTIEQAPAAPLPSIGTSLVDSADGDRILPWNGGTVIDTVAYQNLTPGTEYTLTGELQNKADGTATGITGSTTFTPETANGTIDVTFTIPTGYAGTTLVAFERLHEGTDTTGEPVAVHEDIDDAAQTVTIEQAPTTPTPSTGPKDGLATTGGALPGIAVGAAGTLLALGVLILFAGRARRRTVDAD